MPPSEFALLDCAEQWELCTLQSDALGVDSMGAVTLQWRVPEVSTEPAPQPVGIAVRADGSMLLGTAASGRIEISGNHQPTDHECIAQGQFRSVSGLAVDHHDNLYVVDHAAATVGVVDLAANRIERRIVVRDATYPRRRPIDVAAAGSDAWALLSSPPGVLQLRGRRCVRRSMLLAPRLGNDWSPQRIAANGAEVAVLWRRRDPSVDPVEQLPVEQLRVEHVPVEHVPVEHCVALLDGTVIVGPVAGTVSDIAYLPNEPVLVIACGPGQPLRRFRRDRRSVEVEPLDAPCYDGTGIAVRSDGIVAYRTPKGVRLAVHSVPRYATHGRLVTYRLDSGRYQNRWGRAFVDACLPTGTSLEVRFITTDEDGTEAPSTDTGRQPWAPPLAPQHLLDDRDRRTQIHNSTPFGAGSPTAEATPDSGALYRRMRPDRLPSPASELDAARRATYESVCNEAPGRYLWVIVDLSGDGAKTPRVEAIRVEKSAHRLVSLLPAEWARVDRDGDFLHRFLSPLDAMLADLDSLAEFRHSLLDARWAPADALDWLAAFVGLALDDRWSEKSKRTLISEATMLFRRRGSLATTERLLEIYLEFKAPIVERFRLRGLGGAVLTSELDVTVSPVLGRGTRLGGTLRMVDDALVELDGFQTHAHEFVVLVPGRLSDEQRDVVHLILAVNKPAHTVYSLCETGTMRVGAHLHVGITSAVGDRARRFRACCGDEPSLDAVDLVPTCDSTFGTHTTLGQLRVG